MVSQPEQQRQIVDGIPTTAFVRSAGGKAATLQAYQVPPSQPQLPLPLPLAMLVPSHPTTAVAAAPAPQQQPTSALRKKVTVPEAASMVTTTPPIVESSATKKKQTTKEKKKRKRPSSTASVATPGTTDPNSNATIKAPRAHDVPASASAMVLVPDPVVAAASSPLDAGTATNSNTTTTTNNNTNGGTWNTNSIVPQPQSTAPPPPPVLFSDHEIDEELLQWALLPDNEESNNNHAFSSSSLFIDHVVDPAKAATSSSSTMTITASSFDQQQPPPTTTTMNSTQQQHQQKLTTTSTMTPARRVTQLESHVSPSTTKITSPLGLPFPCKLHRILDDAAQHDFEEIISWVPHQPGLKVHNRLLFETEIMNRYFNTTNYGSFQKQFNTWGFVALKGVYSHPCFIRGRPDLCRGMRQKRRKTSLKPNLSSGRWTDEEHQAFVVGLKECGREWNKIESRIPTRTNAQIRSHAQKYFAKLQRDPNISPSSGMTTQSSTNNRTSTGISTTTASASANVPYNKSIYMTTEAAATGSNTDTNTDPDPDPDIQQQQQHEALQHHPLPEAVANPLGAIEFNFAEFSAKVRPTVNHEKPQSTATATAKKQATVLQTKAIDIATTTSATTALPLLRPVTSTSARPSKSLTMKQKKQATVLQTKAIDIATTTSLILTTTQEIYKTTKMMTTAVANAVTASDTDTSTRQIKSYFFYQAAILPSSLPNGLATIPETMRHLFDRVGSHKLKMMFPNKPQEEINQLLAKIWKQLCDEKLSEVLNLQDKRYEAHDDLRREEWLEQKPNTKYSANKKDPGMIGLVFDAPTDPAFETPTSQVVQEMDLFKELQLYLEREQYNSALPICSDAESFDKIEVFNWFHYPGHKDSQKCIEKGSLWRSKNGYIGECCLNYPYSKWAKLANLLGITTDDERAVYDTLRNRSAFWDACPVIGSNKCGGIHNNATIKDFVTKIFLAFRKKCRNLKHINVFGLAPGNYVREILQPMLQLNGITFSYNNHSQFFMMGGAKPVDAKKFCTTGLVNLSLALNMDPQTVVECQDRIDSDPDLVMTLIKTITPAELEKQQAHGRALGKKYGPGNGPINGQALFESKRGIFAEGGQGIPIFTAEEDELLVMYDRMFSLHTNKWQRIAMYCRSYTNRQCRSRMDTLLQQSRQGLIRNPTSLQKELQERTPLVTSYWRATE